MMPNHITERLGRAGVSLMLLGVLAGCSDDMIGPDATDTGDDGSEPTAPANAMANPLNGLALFVDPSSPALRTAAEWRSTRPSDAALMDRRAAMPQAIWFTGWRADPAAGVRELTSAAAAAGTTPVLVLYNIPQRDCGSYSAGGSGSAEAYVDWVEVIARALGRTRAAVIVEPDALAGMDCLSGADRDRRVRLIADAVDLLKRYTHAAVYVDGGHPRWHGSTEMAARLERAGIERADGFALNVSNFVPTDLNVRYGDEISRLLGGKHFVIDTSRNGVATSDSEWCNPSGRGVGIAPTTNTGHRLIDALLWVKRPGESDGACNGGPAAGVWWPEYALGLMERATSQLALR